MCSRLHHLLGRCHAPAKAASAAPRPAQGLLSRHRSPRTAHREVMLHDRALTYSGGACAAVHDQIDQHSAQMLLAVAAHTCTVEIVWG